LISSAGKFLLVPLLTPDSFLSVYSALLVLRDKPASLAKFAHYAAVRYRFPKTMKKFLLRFAIS
jgi:hypothetical protein